MRFSGAAAVAVGALVGDRREELVQQIAVRHVQLDGVEAEPHRPHGRLANAATTRSRPLASSASGTCHPSANGKAEGATVGQGSSPRGSGLPPWNGAWQEALRPAWASWIAKHVPGAATRRAGSSTRASAASLASE